MRVMLSEEDQTTIWDMLEAGETLGAIGKAIGRPSSTVNGFLLRNSNKRPAEPTVWSDKRMSLTDRENISRGLACGDSLRTIAKMLKRSPSTVSREVKQNGGRHAYRAVVAEAAVRRRVKRPKKRRLETDQNLRAAVDAGLVELWSPRQISNTLVLDHPDDPAMRVSPETIYEAVYLGLVETKPRKCLRTKRPRRKHRHRRKVTPGKIRNQRKIHERPAHIEDRDEVGHWESQ